MWCWVGGMLRLGSRLLWREQVGRSRVPFYALGGDFVVGDGDLEEVKVVSTLVSLLFS